MATPRDQVNVLAELENIGWAFDWAADEELVMLCPFHEDKSPSLYMNVKERVFNCRSAGCMAKGDVFTFLAGALKTSRGVVFKELSSRYDFEDTKIIDIEVVERYHVALWKATPLLNELYARAVTDAMIRKYRFGEHEGRVIIPIPNKANNFVNLRKYLPGAPGKMKMRNSRGRSKLRLYPQEQLKYQNIVLCGGEVKAIVAADQLNKHNIGAVSPTGGEGDWNAELTMELTGKHVWVCLDIDEAGQVAAKDRCFQLHRVTSWVGNLILPLDKDKYPKGDINDFIAKERGEIFPLLEKVEKWEPAVKTNWDSTEPAEEMSLTHSVHAAQTGKRIEVRAVISAVDQAPYVIPKDVVVTCDRAQKECSLCSVWSDGPEKNVPAESPAILMMVNSGQQAQRDAIMGAVMIPPTCKSCIFTPTTFYNVEDVRISPQLEIANRSTERVMQPALMIGDGAELNETYVLTGRMHPHPKNQQSTLLISTYTPTQDALSTYRCHDIDRLECFRPLDWTSEGIAAKLEEIYTDFESNVTRIFQRRDLHLVIDLAYHSPLLVTFDEKVHKGWVEVLVVGDSAQGKSETAMNMMRHYGLGEKVEMKNATVAGLLGGLQQMGSRWFVTWGVVPTHDKRLVIFEEVKGASTEVLAKLTDMRSSGIAEIPKIERRRTHARTRGIWLSNPRSEHQLSYYNFGIEAIKQLVGGLEDVRRFDMCYLVAAGDIDAAKLNVATNSRKPVTHLYDGETCRALVLWAWTRTSDQVKFTEEATALVLHYATKMSEDFSQDIPIVDHGSMRLKIARLAASLAARTFSTGHDHSELLVRPCHVEYISQWLTKTYSSPTFGYADFTAARKQAVELVDPEIIKKQLNTLPFPTDFIKQILHTNYIELTDFQDWTGWDRREAMVMLSLLVRKHGLVREHKAYKKTPPFIKLLKDMISKDEIVQRPSYIPEEF